MDLKIRLPAWASSETKALHEPYAKALAASKELESAALAVIAKLKKQDPATVKLKPPGEKAQAILKLLRAELATREMAEPVLLSLMGDGKVERNRVLATLRETQEELRDLLFKAGWQDFKPEWAGQVGFDFLLKNDRMKAICTDEGRVGIAINAWDHDIRTNREQMANNKRRIEELETEIRELISC